MSTVSKKEREKELLKILENVVFMVLVAEPEVEHR